MNNWKISTRIAAGFAAVSAVGIALGVVGVIEVGRISASSDQVTGPAMEGLYLIGQVQSVVQRNFACLMSHSLSRDPRERARLEEEMRAGRQRNAADLTAYEKTVITERDRDLLAGLASARSAYTGLFDEILQLSKSGRQSEAFSQIQNRLKPRHDTYEEAAARLMAYRRSFATEKGQAIAATVRTARIAILVGLALAVFAAFGISASPAAVSRTR